MCIPKETVQEAKMLYSAVRSLRLLNWVTVESEEIASSTVESLHLTS